MGDPFRTSGKGASPVLARLAEVGNERQRELPREAERMSPQDRQTRLEKVFGVDGNNAVGLGLAAILAWTTLVPLCGVMTSMEESAVPAIFGTVGALGLTIWAIAASNQRRAQRQAAVQSRLTWANRLPFAVRGYELWCLSERPLFDVTLTTPIEHSQLAQGVAAIDPTAELVWFDERTARIFIPPRTVTASEQQTYWYADPIALARLVEHLFVPLHGDIPIERIEMGGAMHKR